MFASIKVFANPMNLSLPPALERLGSEGGFAARPFSFRRPSGRRQSFLSLNRGCRPNSELPSPRPTAFMNLSIGAAASYRKPCLHCIARRTGARAELAPHLVGGAR